VLTRADKWLITVLLFLAMCGISLSFLSTSSADHKIAEIRVDGKLVRTVQLRQGYTERIRIGGDEHYNEIEVVDDRIRVLDADCPDQVCVKTGWITIPSQQIVCLPWRVVIKIISKSQNIDDIAR
jgi:hypothetical protein